MSGSHGSNSNTNTSTRALVVAQLTAKLKALSDAKIKSFTDTLRLASPT